MVTSICEERAVDPIRSLEYIGDATDNLRDARATLNALRRTDPSIFERLLEQGLVKEIDAMIASLSKFRGGVHAEAYGHR